MWGFPKIVGFPPKSSHFNRVFHYVHHPIWGFSPYFWNSTHVFPPSSAPHFHTSATPPFWPHSLTFFGGVSDRLHGKICSNLSSFFPYPKIPHPFLRILLHINLFWKKKRTSELQDFRNMEKTNMEFQPCAQGHRLRASSSDSTAASMGPAQLDSIVFCISEGVVVLKHGFENQY